MSWLDQIRSEPDVGSEPEDPEGAGPQPLQRATPGVSELFRGLREDGSHVVLDLGPAEAVHFRLYSRFARQIRFGDLLPSPPRGAEWTAALQKLPPPPGQPYDIVLMWNVLDRLGPSERPPLIQKLVEVTAPGARLHAIVDSSEGPTIQPFRFTLLDLERVYQTPVGPPLRAHHRLLPAQVERLLEPFEVARAFTLRVGLREYVAVKGGEGD